jgi:hypothetical protein
LDIYHTPISKIYSEEDIEKNVTVGGRINS